MIHKSINVLIKNMTFHNNNRFFFSITESKYSTSFDFSYENSLSSKTLFSNEFGSFEGFEKLD